MTAADEHDSLSLEELLDAVAARGENPSRRQVKRLRSEGLVRCLGQEHAAGVRGSASRYASSEIDQLALVMRIGTVERRFDQRRILVAWEGGWVEPSILRASLERVLDRVSAKVRDATAGIEDPGEAVDLLLRRSRDEGVTAASKLLKRRLGGSWRLLQAVEFAFGLLAMGGQVEWEDHDPESTEEPLERVMERATAVDRLRTDPLIDGRALLPHAASAKETITELAELGMFDVLDLAAPVRSCDADAIARAFRDAHTLANMALFAEAVEASRGPDAGGLGGARLLAPDGLDALTIATLVRATLLFREGVPDAAFDATAAALDAARGPMTVFLELRRALPAHADVIGLDDAERLATLPADRAAELRREVRALFASRPDLERLVSRRDAATDK